MEIVFYKILFAEDGEEGTIVEPMSPWDLAFDERFEELASSNSDPFDVLEEIACYL